MFECEISVDRIYKEIRKFFLHKNSCCGFAMMLPSQKQIYVYFHIKNGKDRNYLQQYDRKLQGLSMCIKIS